MTSRNRKAWMVSAVEARRLVMVEIMCSAEKCVWSYGKFCPRLVTSHFGTRVHCTLFDQEIDVRTLDRCDACKVSALYADTGGEQ